MWFKIIFLLAMTPCLCQYVLKEADRVAPENFATHKASASIQMSFVGERQMILSHKIRIYPNREQEQFLKKSCGVARFAYNSGTVSSVADKWYISIAVEVKKDLTLPKTGKCVGVDLGVKDIAITSDGCKFANTRWIQKSEKKLKRLQRELARRQRASKRREKTRLRLARQHDRVANQRKDWLNKITTHLVRKYDVIALEDLNVRGMVKNHNLAKAITNAAFGEFNRQIEYKSLECDKEIEVGR